MSNSEEYASHKDVKEISDGLKSMTIEMSNLVVEMRHANKSADIMRQEHKDIRKDVDNILQRLPLIESTNGSVKAITNRVVGGIIMAAVLGGLAVGFMVPKAKAELPHQEQQIERVK